MTGMEYPCPHYEGVLVRLKRLEDEMEKWDARVWISMWALVGTLTTGFASLVVALWMAYNIPERIDELEVQAKLTKILADKTLNEVRNP